MSKLTQVFSDGFRGLVRRAKSSEAGATAVEYGIMVALIAVVIIAAVWGIGQALNDDFECVEDALQNSAYDPYANASC